MLFRYFLLYGCLFPDYFAVAFFPRSRFFPFHFFAASDGICCFHEGKFSFEMKYSIRDPFVCEKASCQMGEVVRHEGKTDACFSGERSIRAETAGSRTLFIRAFRPVPGTEKSSAKIVPFIIAIPIIRRQKTLLWVVSGYFAFFSIHIISCRTAGNASPCWRPASGDRRFRSTHRHRHKGFCHY